ncbi:MAG TPA: hypothetical protein VMM18_05680 [Gemmatimonadaceae bacterium]|nr:hypothetical protein [Gemmatimonadaceae bacterium]
MQSRISTRSSGSLTWRSPTTLIAALLLAAGTNGCSGASTSFGASLPGARANADGLFTGLARRFGPLTRDARLLDSRQKLLRSFLVPGAIHRDSTMWSSADADTRTIAVQGTQIGDAYVLAQRDRVPFPARPGDSRHLMHLRQLDNNVYEWSATDELAVGNVRARELYAVATGLLATFEAGDAAAVRSSIPTALPRSHAALGRLFELEALDTRPQTDGSVVVSSAARMHPDRLRNDSPRLARYLERYVSSARYDIRVEDEGGSAWLHAAAHRGVVTIRFRSRDGRLQPIDGPPAHGPVVFRVRVAVSVRVLMFTVGTSELEGDLRVIDEPRARGWEIGFRKEPKWHFPLAVEHLLRAPLRRPFEGDGALLRYVARDSGGAQTVLARDIRIQVQQSLILRWLNRLGHKMASDMDAETEAELLRFTRDALLAVHGDLVAALPPAPRVTDSGRADP